MFSMSNFFRFDLGTIACMHGFDEYHGLGVHGEGVSRMIHDDPETCSLVDQGGPWLFKGIHCTPFPSSLSSCLPVPSESWPMSLLPSSSQPCKVPSQDGVTNDHHPGSPLCNPPQPVLLHSVGGSGGDYSCSSGQISHPTFAETIKFGMGCLDPITDSPAAQGDPNPLPSTLPFHEPTLTKGLASELAPVLPLVSSNMDELAALCLLGQIWDDSLPLPAIIHKTKSDWRFLKGQVEYVDLGNNWILLRFANIEDKEMVWRGRPWFVGSFNFVLSSWVPFLDPFSVCIGRIDQWVRVSRLPWEFWDLDTD